MAGEKEADRLELLLQPLGRQPRLDRGQPQLRPRGRAPEQLRLAGGLRLAAAGVGLGIIGALAATRVLSALVYGVSTTDPLTLASTAAVLIVSAALASWIPARRATRLDPTLSLRAE